MGLDKFKNSHAWYPTVIPSSGKDIHFRAMVMKENMELSLALSESSTGGMETVYETLESCIKESVNVRELQIFDIEWLLLQTQRKSQGEIKLLNIPCEHCNNENKVQLNLDNMRVKNLEECKEFKTINLGHCFIDLQYPTLEIRDLIERLDDNDQETYFAGLIEVCARCIEKVYNEEDVTEFHEEPIEEWRKFVMDLDVSALEKFSEFFKYIPKTIIDLEFTCPSCGKTNKKEISDINNFF